MPSPMPPSTDEDQPPRGDLIVQMLQDRGAHGQPGIMSNGLCGLLAQALMQGDMKPGFARRGLADLFNGATPSAWKQYFSPYGATGDHRVIYGDNGMAGGGT